MKRTFKKISIILIAILCLALAACGNAPETLEEYMDQNPEVQQDVEESVAATDGLSVEVSDNNITYRYDISQLAGITEDSVKSSDVKDALSDSLASAADTYKDVCAGLEESTDVSGITCTVEYCFKDEVLASSTFDADGVVE